MGLSKIEIKVPPVGKTIPASDLKRGDFILSGEKLYVCVDPAVANTLSSNSVFLHEIGSTTNSSISALCTVEVVNVEINVIRLID